MRLLIIIAFFLFFQSCSQEPKIVITKNYISNKYWDEYNNAIYIERMKAKKDGVLDIFSPDFEEEVRSNWDLNDKLEIDSTFVYRNSIPVKEKNTPAKIYFNQSNKNDWSFGHFSIDSQVSTIGSLKNDSWYKFSNLRTIPYFVYVYVDSVGKVHRFNVDMSNY